MASERNCPVCQGDKTRTFWVKAGMKYVLCASHRLTDRQRAALPVAEEDDDGR